MAELCLHR